MSMPISQIRTVAIPVADQDRAVEFYVGTLGFDKRLDIPVPQLGGRWIEVAPPGAQTTMALVLMASAAAVGVETNVRFSTPDAAELRQRLADAGVEVGELLTWGNGVPPMFTFKDADRNDLIAVEATHR